MNCEMMEEERCVGTSFSSERYVVVHQAKAPLGKTHQLTKAFLFSKSCSEVFRLSKKMMGWGQVSSRAAQSCRSTIKADHVPSSQFYFWKQDQLPRQGRDRPALSALGHPA